MNLRIPKNNAFVIAGIFLLVGLVITGLVARLTLERNRWETDRALTYLTQRTLTDIVQRIELYQYGLRGVRGVVVTNAERLSREAFNRYSASRDTDAEFPGARGFGFIRRVPQAEEAAFIESARRDGYPDFRAHQLAPHDDERFIIQYIEPLDRNRQAVGLDIASESNRRNAAVASLRSGEVRLTGPITLVQATGKPQQSFLILMPIYHGVVTPPTVEEREALGYGWSYAPLVMDEVLADIYLNREIIHLTLRDVTGEGEGTAVFDTTTESDPASVLNLTYTRKLFGRDWVFEFGAYPAFLQSLNLRSLEVVVSAGVSISVLGALMLLIYNRGSRAQRQSAYQSGLTASMVASSPDAIITCDNNGQVTSWNQSAQNLFNYTVHEAVGSNLSDLIIPTGLVDEELALREQGKVQQSVPHLITQRRNKQGRLIDVSLALARIEVDGEVTGYSQTIRDMTDEVMAQKQIVEINNSLETLVDLRTKELESSRRTLQGILDSIPSYIGYWDLDLRNIIMNKHYIEMFGLLPGEGTGKHFRDVIGKDKFKYIEPVFNRIFKTGESQTEEVTAKGDDGVVHTSLMHIVPEIVDGKVNGYYTLIHDITELNKNRQQVETLLRENEALLATINEQMLFLVTDANGTIIDTNDRFCEVTGYQQQEIIGGTRAMFESGVHSDKFWEDLLACVRAGNTWRGEVCNRCKDGSLRWFEGVIAPFVGPDGSINRYVSLLTDVTEKRAVEAERNHVNLLLSNVLDAASATSIIATDTEGVITIFNTGAQTMLGYAAEEVVGKHTPAMFHLESEVVERGEELSAQFGEEIGGFEAFVYLARLKKSEIREWTYVRKDGSKIRVSLAVTAMRDHNNVITGYLGAAIDITEQESRRRELLSARDQLAVAAKVARLGIWSIDVDTMTMHWNERMFELYDMPPTVDGIVSMEKWTERVHPDDLEQTRSQLNPMGVSDKDSNPVFRIVTPGGVERSLQAGAQIEHDNFGNLVKVTGINRDITDQLHLEDELRRAKELADSSNAAKSAFLANMSHEIRTPMNAVLGMLQLVHCTELDRRQRDYVGKATTAAKSLLELLNDVLDFSKIEAGKLQLDNHRFDLDDLMSDLGVVLCGYQGAKAVELMFDIDPQLPRELVGDRLRLQQVLINLGGNALKFTNDGQVVVRMEQITRQAQQVTLRISVEDSGIGISSDQIDRIFEDFTQAEASTSRRFGGTGLGLVICKRLVEMMGGELTVASEWGHGSQFSFELELDVVDEQPVACAEKSANILIVEDNPLIADVLDSMLSKLGYQTDKVHTAAAAVGQVQTADKLNKVYDLVLMDWCLPDLSGAAAAEFIAGCQVEPAPPKVIMLTAHSHEFIRSELPTKNEFYCGLLTKPVTPRQLTAAIERALRGQPITPEEVTPPLATRRLNNLQILVVEDNELNRQIAAELLAGEGATVELATGGLEGVEKVLHGQMPYDLVVMDVQMPDIDGLEATRRIRADGRFDELPILAMTANASADDRLDCLAAGMNDHVGKPVDLEQVVPAILALTGGNLSDVVVVPEPERPSRGDDLLGRFNDNISLLKSVQPRFYPAIKQLIDELMSALSENNRQGVKSALHSIKGTAGTMGATALADFAAMVERRVKEASDETLRELVDAPSIDHLLQLFESSNKELEELVARLTAETEVAERELPSLTDEAFTQRLADIIPLLEADNLGALDLIESLHCSASEQQREEIAGLSMQISALEFADAIESIKTLLKEY